MNAAAETATRTGQSFGSSSYRTYVLLSLTFVYTLNFVDRILIGVVAQPIIEEFNGNESKRTCRHCKAVMQVS